MVGPDAKAASYMRRHEELERAGISEEAMRIDRCDHRVYLHLLVSI